MKNVSPLSLQDEPYSPSRPVSPSSHAEGGGGGSKVATDKAMLANISIPSNLQEILASISNNAMAVPPTAVGSIRQDSTTAAAPMELDDDDDEYNPIPVAMSQQQGGTASCSTTTYKPTERAQSPSTRAFLLAQQQNRSEEIPFITTGTSKLSHMSDAELLSLVPDDVDLSVPTNIAATEEQRRLQQQQSPSLAPPGDDD